VPLRSKLTLCMPEVVPLDKNDVRRFKELKVDIAPNKIQR